MTVQSEKNTLLASDAFAEALAVIRRTIPKMGTDRPLIGLPDLTYKRCGEEDWVDGFWSGQLWLAYAQTEDNFFLNAAREQRPYFAARLARPQTHDHDMGFLYSLSVVADYKLTGDKVARELGLAAAASLAARYNSAGRFIRAWNDWPQDSTEFRQRKHGKIIMDCMENLGLLFWAALESGQAHFYEIAVEHATTSARYLVRPDGSTFHTFDFDPLTGQPLGGSTFQGYADNSCWSRGQGWGIHGFAQVYAYTKIPLFLRTAQKLADYALARLPADYIPYWDYLLPPSMPHYRDTSAAAIMAAGLFLLADQLPPQEKKQALEYRKAANLILESLTRHYTTYDNPQAEGLLLQGCSFVKTGWFDNMLPYGDYFYLEALARALGQTRFFW